MTYYSIVAKGFYWIGGTKFSADAEDGIQLVRERDAITLLELVQPHVQVPLEITCPEQPENPRVVDFGTVDAPGPAPRQVAARTVSVAPRAPAPAAPVAYKVGRNGQRVVIGGEVPGTEPVVWTKGNPIHRMNPNRTGGAPDDLQKTWGKPPTVRVPGMTEDGGVERGAEAEFRQQPPPAAEASPNEVSLEEVM